MIDRDDARRRVLTYLVEAEAEARKAADLRGDLSPKDREALGLGSAEDNVPDLAIVDSLTIEEDFGWVFFYQSKKYLESGDSSDALVGNAPLIVSRVDGSLHQTGTVEPVEFYIENFKRFGNPQG